MSKNHEDYDDTLANQPWTATCVCGRSFMQPSGYSTHIRACLDMKNRVNKRLGEARSRPRPEVGQLALDLTQSLHPEGSQGGRKRRRPIWLDDEHLDVDLPPSRIRLDGPESQPDIMGSVSLYFSIPKITFMHRTFNLISIYFRKLILTEDIKIKNLSIKKILFSPNLLVIP